MLELEKARLQLEELKMNCAADILESRLQMATQRDLTYVTNGMNIYYQRVYDYGTNGFYTFTQRMIPDIVIEYGDRLYILDPKYRIASNVGTALGEMHKYRDGIRLRDTNTQVVQKVCILTPVSGEGDTELRYYKKAEFHDMYNMGAICLAPGKDEADLRECVDEILMESIYEN